MNVDKRAWKLYGLTFYVSIAYFLFGYDTGSIGAITTLKQFESSFGELKEIVRGAVVASLLLASAITGIVSGRIADHISRKYTIAIGAAGFAVGSAISCAAPNLSALVVGRVVAGAGEGLFLSPCNTWIIEIAPKDHRGRLASIPQIYTNIGIALGFFVCYGTAEISGDAAWRVPIAIQICMSTLLAVGSPFLPHSPRWLVMHGRVADARKVLDGLMHPSAEAEKEEALAVQPRQSNQSSNIFQKAALPTTLWGCWLQAAQQLTGIDFVLFYAPLLFSQAGLDPSTSSFLASGVTGLVLLASTCIMAPLIDKLSRKTAMVGGGLGIGCTLILIGVLYASHAASEAKGVRYFIIALIEIYVILFATTWGMYTRLYTSEQYMPAVRAAASSFGVAVNQAVNCMVALTAPAFLAASSSGPYLLYGAWTAFTALLCFFMMTDTRGRSLESIGASETASPHKQLLAKFKSRVRSQAPPNIPLHPVASATSTARRLSLGQQSAAERRPSARTTRAEAVNLGFVPIESPVNERPAVFDEDEEDNNKAPVNGELSQLPSQPQISVETA